MGRRSKCRRMGNGKDIRSRALPSNSCSFNHDERHSGICRDSCSAGGGEDAAEARRCRWR
ncbi:unnamed protein product [Amoebophrya sp. A25]|nr:unnamed protein product [Amoebophrya sp. A25]|eukprot:GSA25T00017950001.1